MAGRAITFPRYIRLTVGEALPIEQVKSWRRCVIRTGPPGVVVTTAAVDDEGRPQSVAVIHRTAGKMHGYMVPLARDLSEDEVRAIVEAFAADEPDLDFDVQTNEARLTATDRTTLTLDQEQHVSLCAALAKKQHEDWLRERTDAGWRYGPTFSPMHKTHPLVRPWDQLPERFRQPDLDWPQKLVDMLNGQGYAVIRKDELQRLLGLIQGSL